MNDEVQQIKERLDIVDVISSYLTVKRAGANMKANCPFHNEKTASFMISPEKQTFRCFGCNVGGDIFTFIEQIEGVDFYNALKILADKAGVKLENKSIKYGNKEYKADKKTSIFEINDWAKKLYHKILLDHPKAEKARAYLKKRGMSEATILEFEIGYAPDSWDLLLKFLDKKGYKQEEAVAAGVAIRNERGSIYDRFRGRIMFPINNIMGATVAFTSRILIDNPDAAKYINSSESPIYTKGKTIYGLDRAKMPIKESDLAVMVEGNMDVIACHQAGFRNVVATSGTAITVDQLKILSRYGSEIAFSFDSDVAGETAMKRAVTLSLQNDITTKIVSLPGPFKDPDEAIKSDPKNWQRAITAAKPSLEYWIDLLIRKSPELGVAAKKAIAKEILPVIKTIYSDIEKEYYIKYLAGKLSVSEKALIASLEKTKTDAASARGGAGTSASGGMRGNNPEEKIVKTTIIEKLLGLLWREPKLISMVKNEFDDITQKEVPVFLKMVQNKNIDKEKVDSVEALTLNQYEMLALADIETADEDSLRAEFAFCVSRHRSENTDHLKADFARKIQTAEASGDKARVKKLLAEFSDLIK